ncbi:hypothetical protein HNR62_000576 [Oceanisphaera litoralis]|nr:hypothetical protein [Oceanisphaera litoralis]
MRRRLAMSEANPNTKVTPAVVVPELAEEDDDDWDD